MLIKRLIPNNPPNLLRDYIIIRTGGSVQRQTKSNLGPRRDRLISLVLIIGIGILLLVLSIPVFLPSLYNYSRDSGKIPPQHKIIYPGMSFLSFLFIFKEVLE